jgi:hypothetical protein
MRVTNRRVVARQTGGAGKGIRTLDLLITSNLGVSGVLVRAVACAAPRRAERKSPSYQLSSSAARVEVVHSRQLTSRRSHQQALEPPSREVPFRVVSEGVGAQGRDGVNCEMLPLRVLEAS